MTLQTDHFYLLSAPLEPHSTKQRSNLIATIKKGYLSALIELIAQNCDSGDAQYSGRRQMLQMTIEDPDYLIGLPLTDALILKQAIKYPRHSKFLERALKGLDRRTVSFPKVADVKNENSWIISSDSNDLSDYQAGSATSVFASIEILPGLPRILTNLPEDIMVVEQEKMLKHPLPQEYIDAYIGAIELIKDVSAEYYNWVKTAIEFIIFTSSEEGKISSGSDPSSIGVITISMPSTPIQIAEMLIHEASHQYWYYANLLDEITNGEDVNEYYSPIKECNRPLWAIHLAFHAFANVLLFYRECIIQSIQDVNHCKLQYGILTIQVCQLDAVLKQTKGLTNSGLLLWKPLSDKIGIL